jgi:AraC-like DNA-binding protein
VLVWGAITDLGSVRVCAIRSNVAKAERTARLARDDLEPSIFLGLQTTGASLIVQDDREAVLRPGELVLYDSTVPYTWVDTGGLRKHLFRIPIERLALPRDLVRQVAAVTLSPGHPVADIAATYFQRIAARSDRFDQSAADAVSQPSIELVRALITTHLDASALAQEPLHATLQLRIMEYVRAHLSDPGLNAAEIAAEHHISVRHLYNVLARGGISLGDWIRTQRLEQSRQELARPEGERVTIAAVARRWGFTDPSTFGRLFRAAYGLSPSDWRAMNHAP